MKRKRTSPIWNIPSDEFQILLNTSDSFVDLLIKIGLDPYNGNHKTLNQRIKEEEFDISILEDRRKQKMKSHMKSLQDKKTYSLEEILVKNSNCCRKNLKRKLIETNLLKYECQKCKNNGEWLGEKISLQLDHINGINNDNRIENLRFLCPNCHSQTETYCGKHKKIIFKCIDCEVKINKNYTRCRACSAKINGEKQRKFEISKEELEILIKKYPMTKVGKLLGVSDNAVRKRCKTLDIDLKKRKTGLEPAA